MRSISLQCILHTRVVLLRHEYEEREQEECLILYALIWIKYCDHDFLQSLLLLCVVPPQRLVSREQHVLGLEALSHREVVRVFFEHVKHLEDVLLTCR